MPKGPRAARYAVLPVLFAIACALVLGGAAAGAVRAPVLSKGDIALGDGGLVFTTGAVVLEGVLLAVRCDARDSRAAADQVAKASQPAGT